MKLHNTIMKLIISKKIYVYLLIFLSIGIILMISCKKTDYQNTTIATSVNITENDNLSEQNVSEDIKYELIEILKKVEGVGEIDIMINYSATAEKIPLTEEKNEQREIVYTTVGSKTEPYIATELTPKIEGVVVVAQGANDLHIYDSLQDTVSSILGIPVHKVKILKMK